MLKKQKGATEGKPDPTTAQNNKIKHASTKKELPRVTIKGEVYLDNQDLLTTFHLSRRTLQYWRSKRLLPYHKVNAKVYYKESDLFALLQKHLIKGKKG